jgi:hypothetical protein
MREENDWRLTGQEKYLKGVALWWRPYARYSESWEHDHCEFCWVKFMQEDHPDVLHEGYATEDKYRWICEQCFEDFKDLFEWEVMAVKKAAARAKAGGNRKAASGRDPE